MIEEGLIFISTLLFFLTIHNENITKENFMKKNAHSNSFYSIIFAGILLTTTFVAASSDDEKNSISHHIGRGLMASGLYYSAAVFVDQQSSDFDRGAASTGCAAFTLGLFLNEWIHDQQKTIRLQNNAISLLDQTANNSKKASAIVKYQQRRIAYLETKIDKD